MHFPSDVYAGRIGDKGLAGVMLKNADFAARLAKAKVEYAAFAAGHEALKKTDEAAVPH